MANPQPIEDERLYVYGWSGPQNIQKEVQDAYTHNRSTPEEDYPQVYSFAACPA